MPLIQLGAGQHAALGRGVDTDWMIPTWEAEMYRIWIGKAIHLLLANAYALRGRYGIYVGVLTHALLPLQAGYT